MTPFFCTQERLVQLAAVADQWRGTPWCANSAVRGVGVSCHNLPRSIYIECGALNENFPQITGSPNQASHCSIMEPFMDCQKEFVRISGRPDHSLIGLLQPGDLVGLCLVRDEYGHRMRQRHTNHLGILLPDNWFVHVLLHKQVCWDLHNVSPWVERIITAWRPIEQ